MVEADTAIDRWSVLGRNIHSAGPVVGVDDLVREGLLQILSRDDEKFLRASEYVLSKNKELHHRLP
ncbi:MAG: hypothetical protein R3338_11220 [Thermoanaerobaculia bacterium]|nr:hypothetical protein [Thermoanaerobaculia bacterium]